MGLRAILAAGVTLTVVGLSWAEQRLWPPCEGSPDVFCAKEISELCVCGSNGLTYPNKCMLCLHQWICRENIQIAYNGACQPRAETTTAAVG